jgi:hypothetical protein
MLRRIQSASSDLGSGGSDSLQQGDAYGRLA